MSESTPIDLAKRVFAESNFKPTLYQNGFLEDVARAIQVGKLDGIAQENKRIANMIEANAVEWERTSEAFHASGDFEAEEAAMSCVTVLRGTLRMIRLGTEPTP